jgi:apolipoprotein N-acyltransferase
MTSRQSGAVAALAAAALGALSVLGFAPFRIATIPIGALALLFALWRFAPTVRRAAALGFAFGLGLFLAGTSWIYVSLHTFGGMPAWLTAIATFCFCAVVACYPALAGALSAAIARRLGPGRDGIAFVLVMPAAWTAAELLRGYLLSGFPWLGLGYSQVPGSPLAGFAPVIGSYGVTLVSAIVAGALAWMFVVGAWRDEGRRWPGLALASGVIVLALGGGAMLRTLAWTTASGPPITVALLQGNVAQERKFEPAVLPLIFAQYRRMIERADAELIILPETAFPVFLHEIDAEYLDAIEREAQERHGDVVFGVAIADPRARAYFNGVVTAGTSPPQAYRKRHLVPFGEFLPLRPLFGWVLDVLHIPMGDFTPGPPDPPTLDVAGQRLAVGICYEDAFGNEMRRQLPAATLLVNVSNDAWFGDSLAAEQHYQLAQMRALEASRVMLRANNTGVTGIIGPDGETIARLPVFQHETLRGTAQGREGATPYVRMGDSCVMVIVVLVLVVTIAVAVRSARRPGRPVR